MASRTLILSCLLTALLCPGWAFASKPCSTLMTSPKSVASKVHTQSFIGYLAELLEQKILDAEDLQHLADSIRQSGKILNPLELKESTPSSTTLIHRDGLQNLIATGGLNVSVIGEWLKTTLSRKENEQRDKEAVGTDTIFAAHKMRFHKLPFEFEISKNKTYQIELMETVVTQHHWNQIMELTGNPKEVNHPLGSITIFSALDFANRLSIAHGLKPAYDLTELELEGDASKRDLSPKSFRYSSSPDLVSRFFEKIKYPNELSKMEGYRLPSQLELFLLRKKIGENHPWIKKDSGRDQVLSSTWLKENSDDVLHPVAELEPIILGGQRFYDLIGNISILTSTYSPDYSGSSKLYIFGPNVLTTVNKVPVIMWDQTQFTKISLSRWPKVGIRLVRTVPSKESQGGQP